MRYVDNIYQIKNILPAKDFLLIVEEFNSLYNPWKFTKNEAEIGWKHPNRGCLHKPHSNVDTIGDNLLFIKYGSHLKYVCEKYIGKRLKLHRINTNIQFFGQESDFHKDGFEGSWTLNLFVNKDWDTLWGGHFVVQTEDKDYFYYPYIPNNAILFPGNLEHMGHAPNVCSWIPRLTIAFTYQELTS